MSERAPSDLPDRPEDAMASLGIETDDVGGAAVASLDALKNRLSGELQTEQGAFRQAGIVGRYWPFALAFVFAAFALLLLKPDASAGMSKLMASAAAGLAGLVCLLAAAQAPSKPGMGEHLATAGLVIGLIALGIEGWIASSMTGAHIEFGGVCAMVMLASAALPMGALYLGLKRSGLPVRRRHAAGIAVAGLAMAGATVWLHCPADNIYHLMSGHMILPLLIAVGLSVGFFTAFSPRKPAAT